MQDRIRKNTKNMKFARKLMKRHATTKLDCDVSDRY